MQPRGMGYSIPLSIQGYVGPSATQIVSIWIASMGPNTLVAKPMATASPPNVSSIATKTANSAANGRPSCARSGWLILGVG